MVTIVPASLQEDDTGITGVTTRATTLFTLGSPVIPDGNGNSWTIPMSPPLGHDSLSGKKAFDVIEFEILLSGVTGHPRLHVPVMGRDLATRARPTALFYGDASNWLAVSITNDGGIQGDTMEFTRQGVDYTIVQVIGYDLPATNSAL